MRAALEQCVSNNYLTAAILVLTMAGPASLMAAPAPQLQAALEAQLAGSRVSVVDYDGIVILKGSVTSEEQKLTAEQIVRDSGRERIANLVRIMTPLSDEDLRVRIEREVIGLRIGIDEVSVRASDGIVYIAARIPADSHRTVVDSVARIPGVRQVILDAGSSQR